MTVRQMIFKIEYLQDLTNKNNREIENLKKENQNFLNIMHELNEKRKQTQRKKQTFNK
jgi:hypothetical protein